MNIRTPLAQQSFAHRQRMKTIDKKFQGLILKHGEKLTKGKNPGVMQGTDTTGIIETRVNTNVKRRRKC